MGIQDPGNGSAGRGYSFLKQDEASAEIFWSSETADRDPLLAGLGTSAKSRARDLAILRLLTDRSQHKGNLAGLARRTLGRLARMLALGDPVLESLVQDHCHEILRAADGLWLLDPPRSSRMGPMERSHPEWLAVASRLCLFEAVYIRSEMIESNSVGNRLAYAFGRFRPLDELNLVSRGDLSALADYLLTYDTAGLTSEALRPVEGPLSGAASPVAEGLIPPPPQPRRRGWLAGWFDWFPGAGED